MCTPTNACYREMLRASYTETHTHRTINEYCTHETLFAYIIITIIMILTILNVQCKQRLNVS